MEILGGIPESFLSLIPEYIFEEFMRIFSTEFLKESLKELLKISLENWL